MLKRGDFHMYEEIKSKLIKEKKTIQDRLEGQLKYNDADNINGTGELSQVDNHPGDEATDMFEREKDMAIHHHWHKHIKEIDHALDKIEQGTYGVCEKTGDKMPYERLVAQPTARFIVQEDDLKPHQEFRPVEEEVMNDMKQGDYYKYMDGDVTPEDDATGYTEEFESFLSTGIEGFQGSDQITVHRNKEYEKFTEDIDEGNETQ